LYALELLQYTPGPVDDALLTIPAGYALSAPIQKPNTQNANAPKP
jgi:hypothetical protein